MDIKGHYVMEKSLCRSITDALILTLEGMLYRVYESKLHTHQSREATIPCFFFFSPAKNCATYSTSGKEKR